MLQPTLDAVKNNLPDFLMAIFPSHYTVACEIYSLLRFPCPFGVYLSAAHVEPVF
jgi:hypothetical protein